MIDLLRSKDMERKPSGKGAASVICLDFRDNDVYVLVVKKKGNPKCFFLPGGRIDKYRPEESPDETPWTVETSAEAALRETEEEGRYFIMPEELAFALRVPKEIKDEHFYHYFYFACINGHEKLPDDGPTAGKDVSERRWVRILDILPAKRKSGTIKLDKYQRGALTKSLSIMLKDLRAYKNASGRPLFYKKVIRAMEGKDVYAYNHALYELSQAVKKYLPGYKKKYKQFRD